MIEASGVRRSWLTAASKRRAQLVGSGQRVGLGRLGVEAIAGQGGGQLGGEGGEDLPVLGGQARALQGQDLPVGEGEDQAWPRPARAAGACPAAPPSTTFRADDSAVPETVPLGIFSVDERSTAAPSRRKATISSSSRAGSGLPSGATIRPAMRASMRASVRAWMAAAVRRADRSTSTLTTPAVTRNITRARMSRASAMVKVWMGGAK